MLIKLALAVAMPLLLLNPSGGASPAQSSSRNAAHTGGVDDYVAGHVKVALQLVRARRDGWDFQVTVKNEGERAVFVMANPRRTDGTRGHYFSSDGNTPATLNVSSRVYPLPPYTLYSDYAHVELKQLAPHTSYTELITINVPLSETMPPYPGVPVSKPIDLTKVKYVRASVGVLLDEEGVRDFLQKKIGIGPYTNGLDPITKGTFKGKRVVDMQVVISSNPVEVIIQEP